VVRGVGGERGDQREPGPQAVVDGERAVGAADGDVDLERADELAARDVAVLLGVRS
jgi:hypothetical protein